MLAFVHFYRIDLVSVRVYFYLVWKTILHQVPLLLRLPDPLISSFLRVYMGKTFESIRWLCSLAFQSVPIGRISSERARLSSTLWSPRINQSGERRRCLILQIGGGSRNRASTFSAFENVKRRDKRNRIGVIWSGKRNHPASSSKFSLFLSINSCARM